MMADKHNINQLIKDIRNQIQLNHTELMDIFEVYAAEAVFGREVIDADLKLLPASASLLEVGAGSLMLSCQLLREGFQITALEPFGDGFSHFKSLQKVVLSVATKAGLQLSIINSPAEQLDVPATFDYAFSINVMEHVANEKQVITNVLKALKIGAKYRFICPNYTFPYEPHFNIPTLFSKNLTERFFKHKILTCSALKDPWGTWQSLNWITVLKIKGIVKHLSHSRVTFRRDLVLKMFERVVSDVEFSKRRSGWLNAIIGGIVSLRLHKLTAYIPATAQPVIDCVIFKVNSHVTNH